MNRVSLVARYLLGLLFTVIGLNGFFHFLPQSLPSNPLAVQYLTVVIASHYMVLIFLVQLISGLLLLANRFVPLALTLLAAILFNILLYHITMDPKGIGLGIFATLLWLLTFPAYRTHFRSILSPKPQPAIF
jgi:putative oxidoreductase